MNRPSRWASCHVSPVNHNFTAKESIMKYRVLFICLISLSALRCGGDNPAWSNDLGITVESARIETERFDFIDNIINRLQCAITLSKEGRSFAEDEGVRLVVEFFDGDTSLKAEPVDVRGMLGNGARTEVRETFDGWFDTPPNLDVVLSGGVIKATKPDPLPDRCEVTSITQVQ